MTRISSAKQEYSILDLLVSRTDKRGVIVSANEVFQRVAGYDSDSLIGAPHKLVRHPEMPKGVFWYLWHCLQNDTPVGAYVRNRSSDGGYYWVLATVTPLSDGYLSMRLKPDTAALAFIEGLYGQMLEREKDGATSPEQSADFLQELLKAQGFDSYSSFMSKQIAEAITARDTRKRTGTLPAITHLSSMAYTWQSVSAACSTVFDAYRDFRNTPMNMQIQAGHLRDAGVALGVVASNFATIAGQINADITRFANEVSGVSSRIDDALTTGCMLSLLVETQAVLSREGSTTDEEMAILTQQEALGQRRVASSITDVQRQLDTFLSSSELVRRQLSAFSVTRVMCAIENAQIENIAQGNVAAIIEELRAFQQTADQNLRQIRSLLDTINDDVTQLGKIGLAA